MPSPILNNMISQFEINNIELFIRHIDNYSDDEFSDNIAIDRSLSILAHYAVDKQDLGLLTKLKIRNFSLENNVLIDSRAHSPLSLAIKKMDLPTIKKLVSLGVEVNSHVIDREIKAILMTTQEDIEKKELVRNIINFMIESGFILNIKDPSFLISQDYQDLITQTQSPSNLHKDHKIIIEESNQSFFQSLSQCLKKYNDLDREITAGNRDSDKLGEIEINGLKIPVNAYGLKRICNKIIIKKTPEISIASCFSGVCQRVCGRFCNHEIKLVDYLAKKEIPELQELKQNLKHLDECLKSTANISSYVSSANVSRANSMELRAAQEAQILLWQSQAGSFKYDIGNSLVDNDIQGQVNHGNDRGIMLGELDHEDLDLNSGATQAELFMRVVGNTEKKDGEVESPNSQSIQVQSLRVNRYPRNWQSMQDFSGNQKLESGEIISDRRVLTRQNEIPNSLNSNISRIGLAPIATRLAPIRRSQSL
jgi:hypothetical protein